MLIICSWMANISNQKSFARKNLKSKNLIMKQADKRNIKKAMENAYKELIAEKE